MKIGVVGLGYWGPNLVRNFLSTNNVDGVVCCDMSERRLQLAKQKFPSVEVTSSYDELLARPDVDAVVVATPVSTHFPLGIKALQAGKHLLLEKPMTSSVDEAQRLVDAAAASGLIVLQLASGNEAADASAARKRCEAGYSSGRKKFSGH